MPGTKNKSERKDGATKSYFKQMAATAPIFGAKALLGDVPKGVIKGTVESQADARLHGRKPPGIVSSMKKGLLGRGKQSWKGGLTGIATAPVFVSGMQDVASGEKDRKTKGYAKVVGSGAVYAGAKGIGEGMGRAKELGLSKARQRSMAAAVSLGRVLTKSPGAAGLAYAASKGIDSGKKKKKKKKGTTATIAGLGAVAGGTQGVADTFAAKVKRDGLKKTLKSFSRLKKLKAFAAPTLAGSAAGAGGALLTTAIVNKAIKRLKEKKAFLWESEKKEKAVSMKVPASMKTWFKPYPHQAKAARNLMNNDGKVLLAHEMGTGKTVSSIYGIELLKDKGTARKALVIVPTGLRENFAKDGLSKFLNTPDYQIVASSGEKGREGYVRPNKLDPSKEYTIVGYEMFTRYRKEIMASVRPDTIVADEFHKARNETSGVWKALVEVRPQVKNFIGLTASMVNNDPKEVASLLTIVGGKRMMTPAQFSKEFTEVVGTDAASGKAIKGVKNRERMLSMVDPSVNYVSTKALKGDSMPKKDTKFVDVPMSDDQYQLYQLALDKLGPMKSYIMSKDPKVKAKVDSKTLFAQTSRARQIANSVHMGREMDLSQSANDTPKVRKMLDDAFDHLEKTPDGKIVLYSNLVRGGVDVLSAGLKARGIEHALFVGKGTELDGGRVTSKTRDKGVNDYKSGKVKAIILSGAGAEGLNLPNSTWFGSLDGHFNPERIMQAEARARRLGGQAHRKPENRSVKVRRYRGTVPTSKRRGFFARAVGLHDAQTTDQWIYNTAGRKYKQNKSFYDTLAEKHKYIRKYRDKNGKIRYEYPKQSGGRSRRIFAPNRSYIDD